MTTLSRCLFTLSFLAMVPALAPAQPKFDNPKIKPPDEKTLELIQHRTIKLREAIKALPASTPDRVRVDVEIYLKAVEWAVRHNDFFDGGKAALIALDEGLRRAAQLARLETPWLEPQGKMVARAYQSWVDDSLQPFAVSYPVDYGKDKRKKWRLDVVLHGRDGTICETKFLAQHNGKVTPKENDFVQIDIYGRGNNAYRWAGETDVFEAIGAFIGAEKLLGRDLIDHRRQVIRGFSMGGAGTWHLGLHHPDRWCVMGPGAGFTTTHSYVKSLPNPLPSYQEPLLRIYDAFDYAENAVDIPIVAYSGEKDGQKAAADHIEKRLKELKIATMTHLIGPGLEHKFPPEWQAKAEQEYAKYAGPGKGRAAYPNHVRFVTYTLKYPRCDWVEALELEKHYARAVIDATYENGGYRLKTENVKMLHVFDNPATTMVGNAPIDIDGQSLRIGASTTFEKKDGKWIARAIRAHDGTWKLSGAQGPIDDAFTSAFICVKGTDTSWSEITGQSANAQLQRFGREWDKWMRGALVVKTDKEITPDDIETKNLILFGDPSSNSLIAKILLKLPITWNKDHLIVGGQKYESEKYLPILIYPNPLNPKKYVVLNSGHTFHEAEFKGTNALLFPRLGDYAVVRPMPTAKDPVAFEVMKAGIFDDAWKISEK